MTKLPMNPNQQSTIPVLKILSGSYRGKQFRLLSSKITIGRHRDCDVIFKDDMNCSKYHARIKRENDSYYIESLDLKNPVLVNNKAVSKQVLKQEDKVTIGNVQLLFVEKAPVTLPSKKTRAASRRQPVVKKKWLTPSRIILIALLIGGAFLFLYEDKKEEKKELSLRTESQVLQEVETLKNLNEEESTKKTLNSQATAARAAFIKGFRDYRKGYFYRALKMFQHCLTLHKNNSLCLSYSRRSKVQIDRLIQKKIRLGNAYKENKQYEACRAAFSSVEIMIQDTRSPIYKEARENRRLCEIQLENKI